MSINYSNQNTISYIDEGDSTDILLFIHGMGCNAAIWAPMIAKLNKSFRCIAIDLPEHGNSIGTGNPFTLTNFVETIHEFIVENGLEKKKIHLIGHSMGAQIAIILSIRFSSFFQSLILIAPAGIESYSKREQALIEASTKLLPFFSNEEQMKNLLKFSWFNNNSDKMNAYLKSVGSQAHFSYQHYFSTIKNAVKAMMAEPVDAFLQSISVPCLIIFGEEDKMIPNPVTKRAKPIEIAKKANKLIQNSELVMLAGKGHFLPFEAENECTNAISAFLS